MNGYVPPDAVSFEVIDADTGNTIASFEHVDEAESAVRQLLERDMSEAQGLVLVAFDKTGIAVGSEPATQLLVS
jgi:hypothetical protein